MRISRIRERQAGAHSQERPCELSRCNFRFVHPPAHTAHLWPISDAVHSRRFVAFAKSLEASTQVTQLSHISVCLCERVGLEPLTNISLQINSPNSCVASGLSEKCSGPVVCRAHDNGFWHFRCTPLFRYFVISEVSRTK
jgi:hypothetical protein